MWDFLKRLLCKHEYIFYYNIYGDEILLTGKRSVSKCRKCGKLKWYNKLQMGECKMGQLSEGLEKMKANADFRKVGTVGSYTSSDQDFTNQEFKEMHQRGLKTDTKPQNIRQFEMLGEEKLALYTRKNADYGDSFNKSLDEDGLLVAKIRIMDKVLRFCQLIKNPAQVTEEKLRETLIDLSNYTDMTIMWLDNKELESYGINTKKHADALDAMSHAIVASGADWDGDIVHGQYMNLKEGVIGPKPIKASNPEMVDSNNGYTYNIHVHADNKMSAHEIAKTVAESMKKIGIKDYEL